MAKTGEPVVRYIPSVAKALEMILWLSDRQKGIDLYHLVKAAFFADKYHIVNFGRPIAGDVYRAAWFGPLPQVVYGLLRHEPMEILALGNSGPLPFKVDDTFCVYPEREPNLERLSESDVEALTHGLHEVAGKSFDDLVKETHRDPAYRKARSGTMDYRDFIPDSDPQKRKKIAYLEEVAGIAVF
jgi:antitoxin SocA-like protein